MPLHARITAFFAVLSLVLLQGCAGFGPGIEKPEVRISSLALKESNGLSQRFSIGLVLINPNSTSLPVEGMSYSLRLNGYDLLSGVSKDIPTLAAYAETPITIEGSADLFSALQLLNSLTKNEQRNLRYEFLAKIDLQGWRPSFNITRDGLIELRR